MSLSIEENYSNYQSDYQDYGNVTIDTKFSLGSKKIAVLAGTVITIFGFICFLTSFGVQFSSHSYMAKFIWVPLRGTGLIAMLSPLLTCLLFDRSKEIN